MKKLIVFASLITSSLAVADNQVFEELVRSLSPNSTIKSVIKDDLAGMYLVVTEQGETLYSNASGTVVMNGVMLSVKDGSYKNRTYQTIAKELFEIPVEHTIQFSAVGDTPRGKVLIFFDTTCEYCRAMHDNIAQIRAAGVEVRYLAYPRAGAHSETARVLSELWCSDWSREALDMYLRDGSLEASDKDCSGEIADQYYWGKALKLRGTPAIVFEDGEVVNHALKPSEIVIKAIQASSH